MGTKTNCRWMVTDTSRQIAAGVGFLMHDELSHLLVWVCNARGQGKFSRKQAEAWSQKQANKSQAVISFQRNWSFYSPESSAVAKSGRNPVGTWGQSRWQSLSWYPGEVTFCQNKGLRLLETAPEMGINPEGEAVERAQRIHPQAFATPCHPSHKNPHWTLAKVCQISKQITKKPSKLHQGKVLVWPFSRPARVPFQFSGIS